MFQWTPSPWKETNNPKFLFTTSSQIPICRIAIRFKSCFARGDFFSAAVANAQIPVIRARSANGPVDFRGHQMRMLVCNLIF